MHPFTRTSFLGMLLIAECMSGGRRSSDGRCCPHSLTVAETSRKPAGLSKMNITLYDLSNLRVFRLKLIITFQKTIEKTNLVDKRYHLVYEV